MTPDISGAIHGNSGGVIISVEVTAGARADSFPSGYNPWRKAIGCSVRAEPTGGRANSAVIGLIAEVIGIPRQAVTLVSGSRSQQKKIRITGISADTVREKIAGLLASRGS